MKFKLIFFTLLFCIFGGFHLSARTIDKLDIISNSITELVNLKFAQQIEEEIQLIKKTKEKNNKLKELESIQTTQDKLLYLNSTNMEEINKFVLTSIEDAGSSIIEKDNAVSFFMKGDKKQSKEVVLYLFMDDECIGAGTNSKGLQCIHYIDDNEKTLHTISIVEGVSGEKKLKQFVVYSSSVHFGVKTKYVFKETFSRGIISKLQIIN